GVLPGETTRTLSPGRSFGGCTVRPLRSRFRCSGSLLAAVLPGSAAPATPEPVMTTAAAAADVPISLLRVTLPAATLAISGPSLDRPPSHRRLDPTVRSRRAAADEFRSFPPGRRPGA